MKFFLKLIISFYQNFLSKILGEHCRFYPSCSEYAKIAIDKYGVIKGFYKTFFRILRCNPFNPGGVDFP